jgi:hypothetical protein
MRLEEELAQRGGSLMGEETDRNEKIAKTAWLRTG